MLTTTVIYSGCFPFWFDGGGEWVFLDVLQAFVAGDLLIQY